MHCVVHRQHFKKGDFKNVLNAVVETVNRIKSNPFGEYLFRPLCAGNKELRSLLLHTEVRWLSKGDCLERFVEQWQSVELFVNGQEVGKQLIAVKFYIFYLADVFEKLNMLNK